MKLRSNKVICQVLITASGANKALKIYPAANPEPIASTGDQANQLHQTETGAINLLYLTQATAPYTDAPPDLCGNKPAISAYVNAWIKPNPIDSIHTSHEGLPTVAAIAPIENKTSAGTPLATQNAPCQPIFRCSVAFCTATLPGRSAEIASTEIFTLNLNPLYKFSR